MKKCSASLLCGHDAIIRLMRTEKRQRYFILGIKGVAMTNLAILLKQSGDDVYGVDVADEFITDHLLKKYGIPFATSFKPETLQPNTDFFVYAAGHNGADNVLSAEAKKRNIPLVSQVELINSLMASYKTKIAVCGCHGKTTTSSLLSYALSRLGKKPGYLVGAPDFNRCDGAAKGSGDYFVVEADEYGIDPPRNREPKFLTLHPDYIICTNIDYDHPDVYRNLDETKQAFRKFFDGKKLILCSDDPILAQVISGLSHSRYASYGFDRNADYAVSHVEADTEGTSFDMRVNGKALGRFRVSLFGDKNVSNTSSVIAMLLMLGLNVGEIQHAIQGFTGAKRRFEKVFENDNYTLFDDYGHHPREIEATIFAARKRFPGRRIIVIFQPHTYSRTQILLNEFTGALSEADYSFLLPIFPSARENRNNFSVTSEDIVNRGTKNNLAYVKDNAQLIERLRAGIRNGDVIFTMGAGDVYKLHSGIIRILTI